MSTEEYIANCIHRIFQAEAEISNRRRRTLDVARAVTIASEQGITAAHEYLIRICGQAESGKYKEKPANDHVPSHQNPKG